MMQLMKLEFRKISIGKYIIASIIIAASTVGLIAMIHLFPDEGEIGLTKMSEVFEITGLLVRVSFVIISGILLSQVIIKEYEKNTIKILFTYPISRKKIMLSKLVVVMITTLLLCAFTEILCVVGISVISNYISMIPERIMVQDVVGYLAVDGVVDVVTTVGIGLLPLYFGMLKKSVVVTIVASVIVGLFLNGNIGDFNTHSIIIIPIVTCAIGFAVAYMSYHNIENADV